MTTATAARARTGKGDRLHRSSGSRSSVRSRATKARSSYLDARADVALRDRQARRIVRTSATFLLFFGAPVTPCRPRSRFRIRSRTLRSAATSTLGAHRHPLRYACSPRARSLGHASTSREDSRLGAPATSAVSEACTAGWRVLARRLLRRVGRSYERIPEAVTLYARAAIVSASASPSSLHELLHWFAAPANSPRCRS